MDTQEPRDSSTQDETTSSQTQGEPTPPTAPEPPEGWPPAPVDSGGEVF